MCAPLSTSTVLTTPLAIHWCDGRSGHRSSGVRVDARHPHLARPADRRRLARVDDGVLEGWRWPGRRSGWSGVGRPEVGSPGTTRCGGPCAWDFVLVTVYVCPWAGQLRSRNRAGTRVDAVAVPMIQTGSAAIGGKHDLGTHPR